MYGREEEINEIRIIRAFIQCKSPFNMKKSVQTPKAHCSESALMIPVLPASVIQCSVCLPMFVSIKRPHIAKIKTILILFVIEYISKTVNSPGFKLTKEGGYVALIMSCNVICIHQSGIMLIVRLRWSIF